MATFGLDLPSVDADRFDKAYFGFVGQELVLKPEIDTKLVSYPVTRTVQRRVVEMSCAKELARFAQHWRLAKA